MAVRTLCALIFLSAAWGKMRHWAIFQGVLANYRLLPDALVGPVADLLPPVEALVGLLLLLELATPWPEAAAGALLLVFAGAMGINLRRGRRDIDCGCFQSALKQTLSWALVARNGVLALLLLGVALLPGVASLPDVVLTPGVANLPGEATVAGGTFTVFGVVNGLLVGGVLFIIVQSLTILWSIVPAWRRAAPRGAEVQL